MTIQPIATFRSPFGSKFGIPRQSGIVGQLEGRIVFEPAYRQADALRGIDEFDYLWLIWEFSANPHEATSLTVRPPRLGGNERVGVFASRSPFRPNRLGLSAVRLENVEWDTPEGPILHVRGGDLMDGTPIYDVKPYVAYADCHPDARSGFVDKREWKQLKVVLPDRLNAVFSPTQIEALTHVLELDPRPHYHADGQKTYGMTYAGRNIQFRVADGILTVL